MALSSVASSTATRSAAQKTASPGDGDRFADTMAGVRTQGSAGGDEAGSRTGKASSRSHRETKKAGASRPDPVTPADTAASPADASASSSVSATIADPAASASASASATPAALSADEMATLAPALQLLSEQASRGKAEAQVPPASTPPADGTAAADQTTTAAMLAARLSPGLADKQAKADPKAASAQGVIGAVAGDRVAQQDVPAAKPVAPPAPAADALPPSPSQAATVATAQAASASSDAAPARPARKADKLAALDTTAAATGATTAGSTTVTAPATTGDAPADTAGQQLAQGSADRALDLARGNAWLDGLSRDIATTADPSGTLRFQVAPQQLGAIDVALKQGDDGAAVTLTAANEKARDILSDARPQLIADAQAQGFRIATADVDLGGQAQQQGQNQGQPQHQHLSQSGNAAGQLAGQSSQGETGRRAQTGSQPLSDKPLRNPSRGEAQADSAASDSPADGLYA